MLQQPLGKLRRAHTVAIQLHEQVVRTARVDVQSGHGGKVRVQLLSRSGHALPRLFRILRVLQGGDTDGLGQGVDRPGWNLAANAGRQVDRGDGNSQTQAGYRIELGQGTQHDDVGGRPFRQGFRPLDEIHERFIHDEQRVGMLGSEATKLRQVEGAARGVVRSGDKDNLVAAKMFAELGPIQGELGRLVQADRLHFHVGQTRRIGVIRVAWHGNHRAISTDGSYQCVDDFSRTVAYHDPLGRYAFNGGQGLQQFFAIGVGIMNDLVERSTDDGAQRLGRPQRVDVGGEIEYLLRRASGLLGQSSQLSAVFEDHVSYSKLKTPRG